jgi:Holliday junction resolvase RusA-like endonuclease
MHHHERSPTAANYGAPKNDLAGWSINSENTKRVAVSQACSLEPVTISLAGVPQGKGRVRAFLRSGYVGHYTPEKTRSCEGMIRTAAMEATSNRLPLDRPVEFILRAAFPIPAPWSAKRRNQAIVREIKPSKRPDLDNIAKAWSDALNGVVFRDDALVTRAVLEKTYRPQPLVVAPVSAAR